MYVSHMGGAYWRHLANTIERCMRGGDATLCQTTLTTCYYINRSLRPIATTPRNLFPYSTSVTLYRFTFALPLMNLTSLTPTMRGQKL